MDTFAKGLKVAAKLLEDKVFENFKALRYSSYNDGIGKKIVNNEVTLEDLHDYALNNDKVVNPSGRQEMLEAILK